jgi:protein-disulfide isomerase/uncharacterized membrane protein
MKHSKRPAPSPLSQPRRGIDRILFIGGLLGVLLTVHLWMQESTGFAHGCLGFGTSPVVEASFNCEAVISSGVGTFFGIPNVFMGFGFYLVVALLGFAVVGASRDRVSDLRRIRGGLIAAGFLFSIYLVYTQLFVIEQMCALCMTSAALATGLFGIVLYDFLTKPPPATNLMKVPAARDLRVFSLLAVATVVLAGADVVYYKNLDSPVATASGAETPAAFADQAVSQGGCYYDPNEASAIDFSGMIGNSDPSFGPADAPVTIVEFFDPNCPFCKTLFEEMKPVLGRHGDNVRLVYKPVTLWDISVNQVAALYAAAQEGKFKEMLSGQYDRQQRGGLSRTQLRQIATSIGMDADQMFSRIDGNVFRPLMIQNQIHARDAGLTGVPALFINGRSVVTRTEACIDQLISAELNR